MYSNQGITTCGRTRKLTFKRGLKKYLAKELMPSVKVALTQCSVASPDDPLLWLSKHFLNISSAGDQYELRKRSSAIRTYRTTSTTSINTVPLPSTISTSSTSTSDITLSLDNIDLQSIKSATTPSKIVQNNILSRATNPILQPLTPWEKRKLRIAGKLISTQTQTGSSGQNNDVSTQFRPTTISIETQTTLTGKKTLEELGKEMTSLKRRTNELQSEEIAIHQVFQRLYFTSNGLDLKINQMFHKLDPLSKGISRSMMLKYLNSNINLRQSIPNLRQLFIPETWKRTFDEMCLISHKDDDGSLNDGLLREKDFKLWLTKHATVSRKDLMNALRNDPILAIVLRWSESLHPLLRPREYHRVFQNIANEGNENQQQNQNPETNDIANDNDNSSMNRIGTDRINEQQLLEYVRRSRIGSAEDAHSETISMLFNLMSEDDGYVGKHHLLQIITGVDSSVNAEAVREVLRFSVSLRPLMVPKFFSNKFDEIDQDDDGLLSYNEFSSFISSFTSVDGELAKREEIIKQNKYEMLIANELTTKTMLAVRTLFSSIDVTTSGTIAKNQMLRSVLDDEKVRTMLHDLPPLRPLLHPGKWNSIFQKVDKDDDSKLNYGEFVEFVFQSYAHSLASENSHSGTNFSIAMLRGVALGAGRVGATIGAVENNTSKIMIQKIEQNTLERIENAVTKATELQAPPSWRLHLDQANASAVLIQKRWRGVEERMWQSLVQQELQEHYVLNTCATMIQACYRSYISRLDGHHLGEEELLWEEILLDAAKCIQRAFRAYTIRSVLGVNNARRDDVWIGIRKFDARDEQELNIHVGTLLWLRSDLIDPRTDADQNVVGWYRAALFNADTETQSKKEKKEKENNPTENADVLPGSRLVPSNCVRRCSRDERLQARQGRLPIWARLRCGRYKRDYYHNNLTGQDVWIKPKEFTKPHPMDVLRGLHLAPEIRGAVCMQRAWRHREARLKFLKRLAFASGILVKGWLIATDTRTNLTFWYRPADDQLTWNKPIDVNNEETKLSKDALENGRNKNMKRKKLDKERKLEAKRLMNEGVRRRLESMNKVIEIEFNDGPIGLHLQPRKGGGILITHVEPGCPAVNDLRKGMVLTGMKKYKIDPLNPETTAITTSVTTSATNATNDDGEVSDTAKEESLYKVNVNWSEETDLSNVTALLKDTPRPITLLFVPLKSLRVTEETIKAEQNSLMGRKTVVVTFGKGSMGIEFAPRRKGGCVLLRLIKDSVAEKLYGRRLRYVLFYWCTIVYSYNFDLPFFFSFPFYTVTYNNTCRKSMQLTSINARQVDALHFDDILDLLRTEPRPIKLQFLSAPSRGPRARTPDGWNGSTMDRPTSPPGFGAPPSPSRNSTRRGRGQGRGHGQGSVKRSRSPMATRRSKTVSVSFTEGSLGLEFVSRRKGGVMISNIIENSQSWNMIDPPLRKAMLLKTVGTTNVELWSMKEVLARISAMPRPLECSFVTAPGKDWSRNISKRPESTPSNTTPIGMVLSHSKQPQHDESPMVVEDQFEHPQRSKLLAEQ